MDYLSNYVDFLNKVGNVKRKMKVVCDASNGTAGIILQRLNIPNLEIIIINENIDPAFQAHGPDPMILGSEHQIAQKIKEVGADFGVIFDGDGDRAFFVDDNGEMLYSYITVAYWLQNERPPFIADELTYLSLTTTNIIKSAQVILSRVGAPFIKDAMLQNSASVGAEYSRHYYFKDFFGVDSGIFAMIYTANKLSVGNRKLSEIFAQFRKQELANEDIDFEGDWEKVKQFLKKETLTFGKELFEREGLTIMTEGGWINIRPSNTEPLLRMTVAGKTKDDAQNSLKTTLEILKKWKENV